MVKRCIGHVHCPATGAAVGGGGGGGGGAVFNFLVKL